jgi:hypothetical protein
LLGVSVRSYPAMKINPLSRNRKKGTESGD